MTLGFKYVNNLDLYSEAVIALYKQPRLALDSETYALPEYRDYKDARVSPHTGRIAILTIIKDNDEPYVFDLISLEAAGYEPMLLTQVLKTAGYVLIHNAPFDCGMLRGQFGLKLNNVRCTLVMAQVLSNATGSRFGVAKGHSLADLCRDFLDVHITGKGSLQLAEWGIDVNSRNLDNPTWLNMIRYAATDVKYLFELHDLLYKVLTDPLPSSPLIDGTPKISEAGLGQKQLLDLEFKYIPVIVEKQFNGLPVSREIIKRIQESIEYDCIEASTELCKSLGLETYFPDLDSPEIPAPKSEKVLNNPTKMLEIVKEKLKVEVGNTSTALLERVVELIDSVYGESKSETINDEEEGLYSSFEHSEQNILDGNSKILKQFLKYKKLTKQLSMDLRSFINPATGRIHSRYNALGAATGRLCVAKGEKVLTVDKGLVPINEISLGDLVYCFDQNNTLKYKPVTNIWDKGVQKTLNVTVINAKTEVKSVLRCTPDHLVKLLTGSWVEAGNIYAGLFLLGAEYDNENNFLEVGNYMVDSVEKARDITVYDIEVEDFHNFIASNICCHNSSSKPNVQQISARLYTTIEADVYNLQDYE